MERDYSRNFWVVMAAIAAADLSPYSVGDKHSKSIRDLSAPLVVKYYFSVIQFFATASVLYGSRRCSLYYFQALVIQVTAFLMTLRRKNLVSHVFNVVVYGLLLAGAVGVGYCEFVFYDEDESPRGDHTPVWIVSVVACTAALWRLGPWPGARVRSVCANKYLIWIVMYFLLNHVLRPVLREEHQPGKLLTNDHIQYLAIGEWVVLILYGLYKHSTKQTR